MDNNNCNSNNNTNNNNNPNNNPTTSGLAPHETLELRELLNTEVLGAKKIQTSMTMVSDEDLKSFMQRSLDTKKNTLQSIQQFVGNTANMQ